ncbi:hypothetical protein [Labilibacter marinus]|uniref:hypothetical protein n=1 Tax=Labilibacter marinus TaxID=1477105 RepID=UPI00095014E4|nr:hypothetical protein [Labilibacter marinus]
MRKDIIVLVLVTIVMLVLIKYLEYDWLYMLVILALGILGGVSTALFNAYAKPNDLIYKFMFIIKGAGLGLLIGVGMFAGKYLDNPLISINDLLKILAASMFSGIFTVGGISYISKRLLSKKARRVFSDTILLMDSSRITTTDIHGREGVLVLTQNDLVWYSNSFQDKLTYNLKDTKVKIVFSQRLKIPKDIIINDKDELAVAFPKYWNRKITQQKA